MGRVTIGRIFDSAKALATKPGQELSEMVLFLADFAEQSLRIQRNNTTLRENIDCLVTDLFLKHQVPSQINTNGRTPVSVHFSHVINSTAGIASHAFYFDSTGAATARVGFSQPNFGLFTASGTTITVTSTAHGLSTGRIIEMGNGTDPTVNGTYSVTRLTDNSFSYVVGTSPQTSGSLLWFKAPTTEQQVRVVIYF